MRWTVFKDTLRYSIRMTLIWGVGLGSMMTLMIFMTPVTTRARVSDIV